MPLQMARLKVLESSAIALNKYLHVLPDPGVSRRRPIIMSVHLVLWSESHVYSSEGLDVSEIVIKTESEEQKMRLDWNRGEIREGWAEQRESVWWPMALVLSLCAEWKEAPTWVCAFCMCAWVSAVVLGGRSPLSPTGAECRAAASGQGKWLQASSVTAAQAAPGEWPCTATQSQPATVYHNASHKASQQETRARILKTKAI